MKNRNIYIVIVGILLLLSITALSYALWNRSFTQTGENVIQTGCFNISFTDGNAINQPNTYPMRDLVGKKTDGYTFTVKNTCTIASTFNVIFTLTSTGFTSSETKVYVEGAKTIQPQLLNTYSKYNNNSNAYLLFNDTLAPASTQNGTNGESKTYTFKIWIDSNVGNNKTNKTLQGKLSIQATTMPASSLANKILSDNNIKTDTPDFSKGYPNSENPSGGGLYKAQDDDGDSYYFRGAVENNYVKFANQTWRVVRINGDGSIRLILKTSSAGSTNAGQSKFNEYSNNEKYVGFTYDNTKPCTTDDPCKSEFNNVATSSTTAFNNTHGGTNSTVKTFLENWYYDNLKNYDKNITYGTFCNDTSSTSSSSSIYYGTYTRLMTNHKPSLKCPDANKTYGGLYKTKIGLLSADEYSFAGIPLISSSILGTNSSNYLYSYESAYTLSPGDYNTGINPSAEMIFNSETILEMLDSNSSYYIYPVINLTSDVKVTGNGTNNNPYIVET